MLAAARVFGDQEGSAAPVFLAFQAGAGELGQHPPDDGSVHWPGVVTVTCSLAGSLAPGAAVTLPAEPGPRA
jgi:hypothetical protein